VGRRSGAQWIRTLIANTSGLTLWTARRVARGVAVRLPTNKVRPGRWNLGIITHPFRRVCVTRLKRRSPRSPRFVWSGLCAISRMRPCALQVRILADMPRRPPRRPIPLSVQVEVYFRDGWLCSHCKRPTIFHLAFKLLAEITAATFADRALAYWDPQWRRDAAPLLDELAASIDHIEPYANGGAHDIKNFATICARCNARKGRLSREEHQKRNPPWRVTGRFGEPTAWDGMASVFVMLARQSQRSLTATERKWLKALDTHWAPDK
jgi:hypothetical protein